MLTLSDLSIAIAHMDAEMAKVRAELQTLLARKKQLEQMEEQLQMAIERALRVRSIAEREPKK